MNPIRLCLAAVIGTLALAAAPAAFAKPTRGSDLNVRYDAATKRYCVQDKVLRTGTRIAPIECKTAADWLGEGLIMRRK